VCVISSFSLVHVEPKLSKYGIMTTVNDLEYSQSMSLEWEPDSSVEQKVDDEETTLHTNHQATKTRKSQKNRESTNMHPSREPHSV